MNNGDKEFHEIIFVWSDYSQTRQRIPYGAWYAQPLALAVLELVVVVWKDT